MMSRQRNNMKTNPFRFPFLRFVMISGVFGLAVGGFMMAAAWDHNPQREFHGPGVIHWDAWLPIGVSWAGIVFLTLLLGLSLGIGGYKYFKARWLNIEKEP
jgi:hypothetical protein